jgi:RNA polymerase sigma-70 factor (ECF subfamily)
MRFLGLGRPQPAQRDDGALLAASARGESGAFAEIVDRHFAAVYRFVWRMTNGHPDSEDIAQDAFVKLWQNPAQLREAAALKGWLMRVAANAVIDRSRRLKPQSLEEAPDVSDGRPSQEEHWAQGAAATAIDAEIARLPDRQKMALSLVYFEGMSNIEAAAAMETSVEAVESLLARARRGLKGSLEGRWRDLLDGLREAGT